MIPLKDDNPTYSKPVVTLALIGSCVVVFLWQITLSNYEAERAILALGAIPAVVFQHGNLPPEIAILPPALDILTLLTSMFLHGGWGHLFGNMLFLWIFGDNVEDAMGHARFLLFYVLCGLAAILAHVAVDPASIVPTVGASGAISGVLGAYLLLYPRAKVLVWAFAFFIFRVPASVVLVFWFLMQILNLAGGGEASVAWWAHIAGFVAGMLLILPFKNRHVGLFGAGHLDQTAAPALAPCGPEKVRSEKSRRIPPSDDGR